MKVIVSNHSQPIYGQVTVPLPIPDEEYDHVIELLEALEIGDFRAWDCHVDEICDCPPVLKRLEGTQINIDELDYLAKRLDSFTPKELAAFQGMVEKMDYMRSTLWEKCICKATSFRKIKKKPCAGWNPPLHRAMTMLSI